MPSPFPDERASRLVSHAGLGRRNYFGVVCHASGMSGYQTTVSSICSDILERAIDTQQTPFCIVLCRRRERGPRA